MRGVKNIYPEPKRRGKIISPLSFKLAMLFLMIVAPSLRAQKGTPDAIALLNFGEGGGRGEKNLPDNILGLPDTTARKDVPTIDPAQILSLGLGGEIVLRFDQSIIVDGSGADFTIFENSFRYTIGGRERIYAEPGEVAVSRDGVEFVSFPFDSLSLQGCAGVTPTHGDADPHAPEVSGGDQFDLATIGMDSIRFIRIRDVTAIVKGNSSHPLYDPTVNGFDLDAVVGINIVSFDNLSDIEDWWFSGEKRRGELDLQAR